MLYPKIEDCVEKVGCKYTLTIIAAKRAKDLATKMPAHFVGSRTKEISFALREAADGRLAVARVGSADTKLGATA